MALQLTVTIVAFAVVFGVVWFLMERPASRGGTRLGRKDGAGSVQAPSREEASQTSLRKANLSSGKFGQKMLASAKDETKVGAEKLLSQAGSTMSIGTYLLVQRLCAFVLGPVFALLTLRLLGLKPMGFLAAALMILVMPRLPGIMMKRKAKKRGSEMERELPDALDLLVVCVEGGLSLDGGLLQVSTRTKGEVANELRRLQLEMATGMPRREAFLAMANRSPSDSLSLVGSTITQADKMGMSIATTLRALSESMRTRRRQSAEEKARKAPVKMMPFLIFFMIPALFVIILGPTVLSVMDMM